jgi:hypothetical protein
LSIEIPKIDCVFQSIFALGLRDVELSKQDSLNVNTYGKTGVSKGEVIGYIKNAFQLPRTTKVTQKDISITDHDDSRYEFYYDEDGIPHNFYLDGSLRTDEKNDITNTFFNRRMENGYATTISIKFSGKRDFSHRIVVYKHDNQIYFFDPQRKNYGEHSVHNGNQVYFVNSGGKNIVYISTNLYDLVPRGFILTGVSYIAITNLSSPKPLVNTACPISYIG